MQKNLFKIQRVLKLFEDATEIPFSAQEVEEISNYSYRNFQRIFKKVFSESIENFSRRLRLEKSYKKIIYTNESITDIALTIGYSNIQAFSKAFTKHFKISPTNARINKRTVFDDFIRDIVSDIPSEKVYKKKQMIFYKSFKFYNYDNDGINAIWRTIDGQNESVDFYESYGIIADQPLITPKQHCIYGFAIDKMASSTLNDFVTKEIFGGYYLKFTHLGDYDDIEETYKKFYKNWLLDNGPELGDSPVIEHYVISKKDTSISTDFITDIYFPLA